MENRKKILVVEDSKTNRKILVDTLVDTYLIVEAENGQIAWDILQKEKDTIDLVLTDIMMPVMDGFELLNKIRHNSVLRRIPIIVVTSLNEQENEIKALDLGALEVVIKPYDPAIIKRRIKNILQLTDLERMQAEYHVLKESQQLFDVFIDMALPNSNLCVWKYDIERDSITHIVADKKYGFNRNLSNASETFVDKKYIHVDSIDEARDMFAKINAGEKVVEKSLRIRKSGTLGLSKDDYWWNRIVHTTIYNEDGKPIGAIGISEDISEERYAREKAEIDQLTKVYNRTGLVDKVESTLMANQGREIQSALLMIDLDNFKSVNDNFGHEFGDNVLLEVANRLKGIFRPEDCIARLGGDEFAIFISHVHETNFVLERAEQVRKKLSMEFQKNFELIKITCSVGICFGSKPEFDFQSLYVCADKALYRAKTSGKNIVMIGDKDTKFPL